MRLSDHQQRVMGGVLAQESARREHLVVSLSGAHAYGFPSPDSDLDLKAIHIAPTATLLGLGARPIGTERLEVIEGVEIDYSSNELHAALLGILNGNGNFIERVLGAIPVLETQALVSLRPLVRASLSTRIHRHYRGFAQGQLREWDKSNRRSAKRLLYVLRTTLTGTHALRAGEIVTDVTLLLERYGFKDAAALIEAKRQGEKSELSQELVDHWSAQIERSFDVLEAALEDTVLPELPPNVDALEEWLLQVRRERL